MNRVVSPLTTILLLASFLAVAPLGCGGVKPGSDRVIVTAERAEEVAFDVLDSFVRYESENHDLLAEKAPAVTRAADQIRRGYPAAWKEYRLALDAYKASKTPETQATLENKVAQIAKLAGFVRQQLAEAQKVQP